MRSTRDILGSCCRSRLDPGHALLPLADREPGSHFALVRTVWRCSLVDRHLLVEGGYNAVVASEKGDTPVSSTSAFHHSCATPSLTGLW